MRREAAVVNDMGHGTMALALPSTSCQSMLTRLCAELGDHSSACRRMRKRIERLSGQNCDLMLAHYDEVLAEVRRPEEVAAVLTAAHPEALPGSVPAFGPRDAEITMVEFSDFACSDCARGSPVAEQVRRRYPDVRFVFRQLPKPPHRDAHRAAEAALAAQAQGKFWGYHDVLFSNQHDQSRVALERYAQQIGLNLMTFRQDLDSGKYAALVDADLELGRRTRVERVPAMFVNGHQVPFPYDTEGLEEALRAGLTAE